jgi:predicted nuclease of predicted toxin-antitoxin system
VVTRDADFHAILAVFGATEPSVVRIRLQGLGALELIEVVEKVLDRFGDQLEIGALVTVKAKKASCRIVRIIQYR